ncbi:VOC family protein [Microbacterium gorillae]|uniref:VOC family protein n=1 Tax=Microbacterium gorillae TaxID=1231063 RepID=UPI000AAED2D5|nr:VOC family protein [Microbacterium gorillae]
MTRPMLPTFRGVDHIGLTVPSIDEALAFFVDVLGGEAYYGFEPGHGDGDDDTAAENFDIDPSSRIREIRLVRMGNLNLELFEWVAERPGQKMPSLDGAGGHELCLYVDDVDAAVAHLKAHDIEILGDKLALEGPEAGPDAFYIYFRAPWGLLVELISYPHGRAYEREFKRPLWNPSRPDVTL